MIRTLIALSIAIATLFVGACQDDMSLAAEAQAHTNPNQTAGGQSDQTNQSRQPSEGPEGSEADQTRTEQIDQSMTDDQARQLLREDWMEEQSPQNSGSIGEKDGQQEGSAEEPGLRGVINLNTATMDDLMMLPGVGPATAARISDYRQKRRFTKPEHLKRIKGIGPKTWAKLKPYIAVSGETTLSE